MASMYSTLSQAHTSFGFESPSYEMDQLRHGDPLSTPSDVAASGSEHTYTYAQTSLDDVSNGSALRNIAELVSITSGNWNSPFHPMYTRLDTPQPVNGLQWQHTNRGSDAGYHTLAGFLNAASNLSDGTTV